MRHSRTHAAHVLGALAVVGLLSVFPGRLAAQVGEIDLDQAVQIALSSRPELSRAAAVVEAEEARRLLGLGLNGPTVAFSREGIGDGGFGEQKFGVYQELPFPTALRSALRANAASVRLAEANQTVLVADVRESVRSAYVDVLYAQQLLALRERAVELGRQLLQSVEARIEVGEAAEIDLLKAQLQEAEARDLRDSAERAFHASRYALFRSIGLDPEDQQYSISFADSMVFRDVIIDQDLILEKLPGYPEMTRADLGLRSAEAIESVARHRLFPNLIAGVWSQDLGTGYDYRSFEAGLRLPLTEWLSRGASRREAKASVAMAEADRHSVTLDLKQDIERRWHSYDISRKTLLRYEQSLRGRGETLVALTREGYRLGELDLLTLLDAQRTYVASQVRYLEAMHAYQRDVVRLERYAGRDLLAVD